MGAIGFCMVRAYAIATRLHGASHRALVLSESGMSANARARRSAHRSRRQRPELESTATSVASFNP